MSKIESGKKELTVEKRSSKPAFEPRIIGFTCTLCSNHPADLVGEAQWKYPAKIRLVRVMCSGRLEPRFVLKAFASGADGVIISGCQPGQSPYVEQKTKIYRRFALMQAILSQVGIEPERLVLVWLNAEGTPRFSEDVNRLLENVHKLGPLQLPTSQQVQRLLAETLVQQPA